MQATLKAYGYCCSDYGLSREFCRVQIYLHSFVACQRRDTTVMTNLQWENAMKNMKGNTMTKIIFALTQMKY